MSIDDWKSMTKEQLDNLRAKIIAEYDEIQKRREEVLAEQERKFAPFVMVDPTLLTQMQEFKQLSDAEKDKLA